MKIDVIAIVLAIIAITVIWFYPVDSTNFGLCPQYSLPDQLERRTDGDCAAIGMLLEEAVDNPAGCVYVTNSWWRNKIVDRTFAAELTEGW